MKVMLVIKSRMMENLGVMHLSAVVKKLGHQCKIVDLDMAGLIASAWKPDFVGMSIMTGDMEKFRVLDLVIKDRVPGVISIVGGPDVTFFPEGYEWADNIVRGEGEEEIARILGADINYPDIDSLPWPDRTDFPNMKIRDFIASRGCPFDCKYCFNDRWNKMFPGSKVRTRDAYDVVMEIRSVNPEYVYFQDSCFGTSTRWLRHFAIEYNTNVNVPYQCHMRPSQVTEERVKLLSLSNCHAVRIALETASDRLREMIGRGNTSNQEAIDACRLLRSNDIHVMLQNILGLPTSTIEEDLHTLEVNIECKPSYAWSSIYVPYPGTDLGDMCKEKGYYSGDYSEITDSFFDRSVLNFDEEHKEQLVCLQRVFALCAETGYLPKKEELTYEQLPMLIHKAMRKLGDYRLYAGLL